MKAPVCRTCGKVHWSRLCYTDRVERNAERYSPETESVTVTPPETHVVTPRQADLEVANRVQMIRIAELEQEVRQLKQQLAGKAPMTSAERVRKHRERKRQL